MNRDTVEVFLPCRAGSKRVPRKNTRPFGGREDGLLGIKLDHLETARGLDRVVLDSDDPLVLERGETRRATWSGEADLVVRERPAELGRDLTTTDELIRHALEHASCDLLLWTHVTSPLFDEAGYEAVLRAWRERDDDEDSVMTVTAVRSFVWNADGPLNYRRDPVRWPRTQTLDAVFEVNSAAFLVPVDLGRARDDRIGVRPRLLETAPLRAMDVDWPADFEAAEAVFCSRRSLQP